MRSYGIPRVTETGSSLLPSTIRIGDRDVQLGDVVRYAVRDLRKTAEEWNAFSPLTREHHLVRAVYAMRVAAQFEPERLRVIEPTAAERAMFVPHEDLPTK